MDRATRRDFGLAGAVGLTLAVGTLALGVAFVPGGGPSGRVDLAESDPHARLLQLVDGVERAPLRRGPAAPSAERDASRGAGDGAATGAGDAPDAGAAPRGGGARFGEAAPERGRIPSGDGAAGSGGPGSGGGAGGSGATPGGSGAGSGGSSPGGSDGGAGGTSPTAGLRLRVASVSLSGGDGATLRAGSEVRVRVEASGAGTDDERNATAGAAVPGGTTSVAPPTGVAAASDRDADPVARSGVSAWRGADEPVQMDVRVRLGDETVRELRAAAARVGGPVGLRAVVDLTRGSGDSPDVRVRLQIQPFSGSAPAARRSTAPADGALSNAVELVTPIDLQEPAEAKPAPSAAVGAEQEPVEVRIAVPQAGQTASSHAGVGLPEGGTGDDAAVSVALHLPAADEPLGGTPVAVEDRGTGDVTANAPADPGPGSAAGEGSSPEGGSASGGGASSDGGASGSASGAGSSSAGGSSADGGASSAEGSAAGDASSGSGTSTDGGEATAVSDSAAGSTDASDGERAASVERRAARRSRGLRRAERAAERRAEQRAAARERAARRGGGDPGAARAAASAG
jgi:hypothetical protein